MRKTGACESATCMSCMAAFAGCAVEPVDIRVPGLGSMPMAIIRLTFGKIPVVTAEMLRGFS